MNRSAIFIALLAILLVSLVPTAARAQSYACDQMGCDACDGQSGCDSCFSSGCTASGWGASVDALFLTRSNPRSRVLAFNTDNPAENLNAADFHFATQAAVDASLSKAIGNCNALELRYFGVDDWDARANVATTRGDLLQFNAAPPVTTEAGDAIAAFYSSELQNAEINVRHLLVDWLEVLAGFRYLELKERGGGTLVNADVPFSYLVATRNRLYGGQLGAQALLWNGDLFRLDVDSKAGIFGNDATHSGLVNTDVAALSAGGAQGRTSFVGELGINGATHITKNFALRCGYRLLWINNVALASNQLAATDFFTGNGFNGSGDVFYHGGYAGLELMY